jgi:exodeoxyribonuclease VII large subunit
MVAAAKSVVNMAEAGFDRHIYQVSELSREVRLVLEQTFPIVWVEGEISNLRIPSSGHWYFTLKDSAAQLRCAMFVNRNRFMRHTPRDGMTVIIRARLSIYEGRGEFQAIVEHIEPAGEGALRIAFEELKGRLQAEGLFASERKRALPNLPRHIGIVTSASGAALRDILTVLRRRFPQIPVTLLPVSVQGESAVREIVRALRVARLLPSLTRSTPLDVVILGRGGGSLEDFKAFNDEAVARAIADCPIPVVSAVGHETDVTIADFVADVRAATPSAAAELVVPDRLEWSSRFEATGARLRRALAKDLRERRETIRWLRRGLRSPAALLRERSQRIDDLEARLRAAWENRMQRASHGLEVVAGRLRALHPEATLATGRTGLAALQRRLGDAWRRELSRRVAEFAALRRALNAVSPLGVMERGYALVTQPVSDRRYGPLVRSVRDVDAGDLVDAHLRDGVLSCRIESIDEPPDPQ